ncbi:MAG: PucR family transcriptional regulator [Candidatus Dormibacteria bacterium]
MKVADALELTALAGAEVVAGAGGTDREVRWANVVDIPDPLPWVGPGQLLLTTGFAWPRRAAERRRLVRELVERELAAVALAVPKYLEHFPAAVRQEADRAQLPLLEVPWEVPFAAITQAINGTILAQQYEVIEQSSLIHKELTRAAVAAQSLQDIADTLGRLIQRDVTLEEPDGRLLAFWHPGQVSDRVRRQTLEEGATPKEVLAQLDRLGYLGRIRSSTAPVRIPADPEINLMGRVVCPIWLRDELLGMVWIVEGTDELSDLHLRAAEHAALVAALHMANQRQLALVEVRLGSSFLDALLEGHFTGDAHALERARLIGYQPEASYRVGLLCLHSPLPLSREAVVARDRAAERLRHQLERLGAPPITSARLDQVAFLLPEAARPELAWAPQPGDGTSLALGRAHSGPDGVRRSHLEAQAISGNLEAGAVGRYEEMLLLRVLGGDEPAREAFLEQVLGPLRRARGGGTLATSLLTLTEHGFHRRRTAAALHVHPNTLRYRLERCTDLLGVELTDPEVRFRLQLAAHLMSLAHKRKA